jgi:phage terminase large subunit-like protein
LFRAGNQLGKSLAGGAEAAMHATGRYPDWWDGKRFDKANDGWASGVTGEVTRDTIQRLLIGAVGKEGTGFIPHKDIKEVINARGVAGLADTILVQHVRGGVSRIKLKYYEQGREKFQADTLQWAWNDEEPPDDIYMEILTRTNATGGILWTTFTPLLGMSTVVRRFLNEPSPDRVDINMTISDVTHISEDEKLRIIASYPAHEREARINGKPMLGSGRIFPVSEELIKVPRFEVPQWYRKIGGIDFGWDHPTAATKIAYNPDSDIIYLINVYKRSEAIPAIHASALKSWGKDLPWSWPHDGLQHDKGSGENLADQYRREGLNMLPERATFDDGSNGVEAGIMDMLTRMENGTFKVFDSCQLFFDEMLMYHRKEGKVVKEFDDVISACLHPDSEIITRNGVKRIADLVGTSGDVLSVNGTWQQYRNCRMTRKDSELVRVVFSDGHELLCTPDHRLLSRNGEWIEAIDSKGMMCHSALRSNTQMKIKFHMTRTAEANKIAEIISFVFSIFTESFNWLYMSGAKSFVFCFTMLASVIVSFKKLQSYSPEFCSVIEPNATSPMGAVFLSKMSAEPNMSTFVGTKSFVRYFTMSGYDFNAARFASFFNLSFSAFFRAMSIKFPTTFRNSKFLLTLRTGFCDIADLCFTFSRAACSQIHSRLKTAKRFFASWTNLCDQIFHRLSYHKDNNNVNNSLSVLRVESVSQRSDVYCLEVPTTEAFALANGAIVHNCRYAIMMLRYSRPDTKKSDSGMKHDEGNHQYNYNPLTTDAARGL